MNTRKRLAGGARPWLAGAAFAFAATLAAAQPAPTPAKLPTDLVELVATFNDDVIPFNDQLVVLGKADAKVTAVLIYGLSGDTSYLMDRIFARIKEKYVDTGKLRLIVYDFPLTWHDMQALAGFRCLPAEQHLAAMQAAVRYPSFADGMKRGSYMATPARVWRVLKDFDITPEKAEKCMRNTAIIGHVEALRRTATNTWGVTRAPSLIVNDRVIASPSSLPLIEDALNSALKESR